MTAKTKKTIVFGIDGVCWEYLNPLLRAGKLPNLANLMRVGAHGILKSTQPPLSPLAWSSFLTGRNPGNHGVMDWWHADDDKRKFRPSNALDRKGRHFWDYLNAAGLRVGIQNIPMTYPAGKPEGYFISGWNSPEQGARAVFPTDVRESIERIFGTSFPVLPRFSMLRDSD
ncbi:MAG: hypothetical protein Kow0099_26720 [Candidatus Abyssubacteria bacterium]